MAYKTPQTRYYTEQQQLEALAVLQSNEWNFQKTSIQLGIQRATLERWGDSHPEFKKALHGSEKIFLDKIAEQTATQASHKRGEFLNEVYDLKLKTVKHVKNIVEDSDSIRDLSGLLKILHEITDGKVVAQENNKPQNTFYNFINKQLIGVTKSQNGED